MVTFIVFNIVGTSTHYNSNSVYASEKERREAINMDKIVKIFPASIKEYPNCTGILLDNHSVLFTDDTFDGVMRYISNMRSDDYDAD